MIFSDKTYNAVLSISTSGDNTLIAAPGNGRYIAIDFILMFPTTAVGVLLKSGSTSLSATLPLDAKQAIVVDNAATLQDGIITCANNEAFVINLDSAVQLGGWIKYRIIGA